MTEYGKWRSLIDGAGVIPDSALYWNGELGENWVVKIDQLENSTFERREDSLYINNPSDSSSNAGFAIGTDNKYDLTNVSQIRVLSSGDSSSGSDFYIAAESEDESKFVASYESVSIVRSNETWSNKNDTLDVSQLTGGHWIGLSVSDYNSGSQNPINVSIFEVELVQ